MKYGMNLIRIYQFQRWVSASLNLDTFSHCMSSQNEVITSSYLVKIMGTHVETIKDGGTVFRSIFKIIGHLD